MPRAHPMPYIIADESFATKDLLTARCREILAATPDGEPVEETSAPFLFELFKYHDEWQEKAAGGVRNISTQNYPARNTLLRSREAAG
jgi:hypothetical protein